MHFQLSRSDPGEYRKNTVTEKLFQIQKFAFILGPIQCRQVMSFLLLRNDCRGIAFLKEHGLDLKGSSLDLILNSGSPSRLKHFFLKVQSQDLTPFPLFLSGIHDQ